MTTAIFGLLWGLYALGGGPDPQPPGAPADTLVGPGDAVPFVAQTPLLCGGAAAAMVQRHLGARGVHGRDFAHLVRPDEGGIRTSELVGALIERGYPTRQTREDPDAARAALEAGLAPILLLESGGPEMHYVVLVGMDSTRAWYHDPNWGPSRSLPVDEFLARWAYSGFWMATTHGSPDASVSTSPASEAADADRSAPDVDSNDASDAPPPAVDSAMALLRTGDHRAARAAVAPLRHSAELDGLAWRITATAHYLEGDQSGALRAWNRIGEPRVDLVRIDGLRRTRYHAARRRIGVDDGEILAPDRLRLARRRLAALPSIGDSRVSIQPVEDGVVEVHAAVVEAPRWPGRLQLGATIGTALLRSEARLEVGPLFGAGDRWTAMGAWHPARDAAAVRAAMPAPPVPGVVRLGLDWRRETHASTPERQERLRGELAVGEWIVPSVRLEGAVGIESWSGGPRRVSLGGRLRWLAWEDRLRIDVAADRWTGGEAGFGRVRSTTRARLPFDDRREVRLRAGWTAISESAPRLLWPGAGVGPFRELLLRAHSVESGGALGGPTLAPDLGHAGLEYREYRRFGPVRVGGMAFADLVAVPRFDDVDRDRTFVDVGIGAVLDVGPREAQLTIGHGEDGWQLSARLLNREIW